MATRANYGGMSLSTWSTNTNHGPIFDFKKSASNTIGTQSIVSSGELLGSLSYRGSDGSAFQDAAAIHAYVDDTPGLEEIGKAHL